MEFVNHNDFDALLWVNKGWPLDLVWMAYDRAIEFDWDYAAENDYCTAGPYFRYDPYNSDIDDRSMRYCGPNFDDRIGGDVSLIKCLERHNLLPMAWYRYEKGTSTWSLIMGLHFAIRWRIHSQPL